MATRLGRCGCIRSSFEAHGRRSVIHSPGRPEALCSTSAPSHLGNLRPQAYFLIIGEPPPQTKPVTAAGRMV